jgi:hypothetical protein
MISMGHRGRGARLSRRSCDHVIMPGALIGVAVGVTRTVIGMCMIGGLRMIMHVLGCCWWFRQWIADMFWN